MLFNNLKISLKITLLAGLCILILAILIIGYSIFSMRQEAINYAKDNVSILAEEKAREIEVEIESSFNNARTLAQTLSTQIKNSNNFTRNQVNNILKEVLATNPGIIGTYTLWEPNAFDGNDKGFANTTAHDETGRFIPYWNKDSQGNIAVEALLGYEEEGIGDYYLIPKKTKSESILDPYLYPIQGVDVLITSLVVPIVVNDIFYGIAGVDITLDFLQGLCNEINIYDNTGSLSIFSNNGTIAGITNKNDLVGKFIDELYVKDSKSKLKIIKDASEYIGYRDDEFTVFKPIKLGNTITPWSVAILLPDTKVLEGLSRVLFNLIILGILFAAIALFILWRISKKISNPIKKGVALAERVSLGDLTSTVDIYQNDEIGLLAESLRQMVDKLSKIVGIVSSGSEQIVSASTQLAMGNQDLSNRTEQQATELEETSAAIELMNTSIRSNADNTITANQLSLDVSGKADEGTQAVNQMITSMNEISDSSDKISDIIEVINNIAFQTNLLALNASIEAARAGEQGKGFAVVAVEVRKLAKRSDKAASEISKIIKSSNKKVLEGVEIANTAGEMLAEINSAVKKVTVLIGEISAASQEQLSSVDQIDQTLSSLDENTQKNASLVEEAAAATEELSAQAIELNKNMKFFKLKKKTIGENYLDQELEDNESEKVDDEYHDEEVIEV